MPDKEQCMKFLLAVLVPKLSMFGFVFPLCTRGSFLKLLPPLASQCFNFKNGDEERGESGILI